MTTTWMRSVAAAGLGWALMTGGAYAQQDEAAREARPAATDAQQDDTTREARPAPAEMPGPIDSPKDLQDTARMLFMMADTDNDAQISRDEAVNVGNRVVGGFFFSADQNGDGALTREEAQQARQEAMQRQPILRVLVQEVRRQAEGGEGSGQNPLQGLANLLDENNDQQIQASEARAAVETAVDAFYAAADTDRDGQMRPGELNAAVVGLARAAAQAAFRQADADNSGTISQEEFETAVVQPARVVFGMVDGDDDGQISPEEARAAQRTLMNQMRIEIPQADPAPVPDFNLPAGGAPARGGEGGQGQQDRPARQPRTAPAPGTSR